MRMNKLEQCRHSLEELQKEFPQSSSNATLKAALAVREGRADEALALLNEQLKSRPQDEQLCRAIASMHLVAKRHGEALKVLRSIGSPSGEVLRALIALSRVVGGDAGRAALADAAQRVSRSNLADRVAVLTASAELKQSLGDFRGAAEDYKEILSVDPKRLSALSGYVSCASNFDANLADAMAETLPNIPGLQDDDTDVEKLEAKILASSTYVRKEVVAPVAPAAAGAGAGAAAADKKRADATTAADADDDAAAAASAVARGKAAAKKKRKNKKRKSRLPKQLSDDPPDPERWLPMKMRSYYVAPIKKAQRTKGGKKRVGGAHQGVNVTGEAAQELDLAAKKKAEQEAARAAMAAKAIPKSPKKGGGKKK